MPGYSRPPPKDELEDAPCVRCDEVIDPTVRYCPHCGNCPYKDAKWNGVKLMAAGLIASITVVGAIIGIPLFVLGVLSRLGASSMSPTEHDTGGTMENVANLSAGNQNGRETTAQEIGSSSNNRIESNNEKANWEFDRIDEQPYNSYTEAIEDIKQLKRENRHEEVEELLLWCIDYTEAKSRELGYGIARAYYRHLAIVYRKDNRHSDEVNILERYVDICEELGENPHENLVNRLKQARKLAS